jgi:hypothetical protein
MKRYLAILCLLALGACSTIQTATAPVPTVKAQQALDLLQATHKTVLQAEVIYILQPACGLKGSPPAPACASYAVGLKMKALDATATKAIAEAQKTVSTLGATPAAIDAAIAGAQLAVTEFQNFTNSYGAKP